jgi:hypothetical protein
MVPRMENTSSNREPLLALPASNLTFSVPTSENGPDREVTLTPAQQQALQCLFEGASISQAAQSAGVARQTINRWLRDSVDFQTVYNAWHREMQKSVKDRMAALGDFAMDNIASAIRSKGNLRASEFVVKHLLAQKQKNDP